MINLTINGIPHRIVADTTCWTLGRVRVIEKTGEEELVDKRFFLRLEHIADRLIRLASGGPLDAHLALLRDIEAQLRRIESVGPRTVAHDSLDN
jgi:hypothetical protein